MDEVIPIPKTKTTLKSFTDPRDRGKATDNDSQFTGVTRFPMEKEVKSVIGLLVVEGVDIVMSNHYYTIGDIIRRQEEGGAIGSDMTGEVTRTYMIQ